MNVIRQIILQGILYRIIIDPVNYVPLGIPKMFNQHFPECISIISGILNRWYLRFIPVVLNCNDNG